jgi:hypothetical protein
MRQEIVGGLWVQGLGLVKGSGSFAVLRENPVGVEIARVSRAGYHATMSLLFGLVRSLGYRRPSCKKLRQALRPVVRGAGAELPRYPVMCPKNRVVS